MSMLSLAVAQFDENVHGRTSTDADDAEFCHVYRYCRLPIHRTERLASGEFDAICGRDRSGAGGAFAETDRECRGGGDLDSVFANVRGVAGGEGEEGVESGGGGCDGDGFDEWVANEVGAEDEEEEEEFG